MRVIFGAGSLDTLGDDVLRLGVAKVLVLATPQHRELADRAANLLGEAAVGVFDKARTHVPDPAIAYLRAVA